MSDFFSGIDLFQSFFVTVSVLLVISILLQQKSSSLGSMMGGDGGEEIAQTRRGADKFLYRATVVLATFFVGGGVYAMFFVG